MDEIFINNVMEVCENFLKALESEEFGSSYKEEQAKKSSFNEILDLYNWYLKQ